jgi:hypothetical protein
MAARKQQYIIWHFQNALIYFVITCIISGECWGTTVGNWNTLCPVCEKEITVLRVGSFGSYIFEWESKYDLIYFPYDDPEFIWMCAHCGYAQAAKDFDDLSRKEKRKLKDFLSTRWEPASPNDISIESPNDFSVIETRLNQAILVNKFLEKDDDFWAWFNRVLIFHYRKINPDKAKNFATVEIELLKKNKGQFQAPAKNRAYLLGEYNRLIGKNELARKHFYKALKVDMVSEVRNIQTALIVINFTIFILLLFLWIKRAFKKNARIIFTIAGIIVFALSSFALYLYPGNIQHWVNLNNYCNEIIYDRIKLLNTQSDKNLENGKNKSDNQSKPGKLLKQE